jgi:hypothetical protein
MAPLVCDAAPSADDRRNPLAGPQIDLEAGHERSVDHQVEQFVALLGGKLADSARVRLR